MFAMRRNSLAREHLFSKGGKLVKILQEAGFGLPDLGLMFLGLALIAGGLVWVVKHLPVRSVES